MSGLRVAYIINDAAFFVSHRLSIALKVMEMGGKVCLITGTSINKDIEENAISILEKKNVTHYKCNFSQGFKNPISELCGLFQLIKLLRKYKPTTVHSATAKANLMSLIACNFIKKTKLILSVSGMGTMFTGKVSMNKFALQTVYKLIFKISLRRLNFKFIFQNKDDYRNYKSFINFKETDATIIKGSGVDTSILKPIPKVTNIIKVLLPARMLYEKGVQEFVNAAKILKYEGTKGKFYLAGDTLTINPSAIKIFTIEEWVREGLISYLGYQYNLKKLYKDIDIVCLPSWREGFPKVLMEAASFGLPVITTDVPGCRDAVIDNKTGIIVPVQNEIKLAKAIKKLIQETSLRKKMGKENRNLAINRFDLNTIIPLIVKNYE